ncbi:MAG: DUF6531 domain-containing protein [Dehalococcoidia bacterium]
MTDTANASMTGTSGAESVGETTFATSWGAGSVPQGTSVNLTVQAKDSGGNVVTGYRGRVTLSSSWNSVFWLDWGAGVDWTSGYTFTAGDGGSHTFTPKFAYAGDQTATITDQALASRTVTSAPVAVTNTPAAVYSHVAMPSGLKLADGSVLYAFLGVRGQLYTRRNVGTLTEPAWRPLVLARGLAAGDRGAATPSLALLGSTIALFHTYTDGTYYQLWVTTSTDNGATWGTPVQLTSDAGHAQRVQAVVSGGAVYLFWSRQDTNRKVFYQSTTDLVNWTAKATVGQDIGVPVNNTTSNFGITRLPSGTWALGWLWTSTVNELPGIANNLLYPTARVATSTNLTTWTSGVELHLPYSQRGVQSIALATDPATGQATALFDQFKDPWDVYIVRRTSGDGVSWAAQATIGYERGAPANGQQGYVARFPTVFSGSENCLTGAEVNGGNLKPAYGHQSYAEAHSGNGVLPLDCTGVTDVPVNPYDDDPLAADCPTSECAERGEPIDTLRGYQSTSAVDLVVSGRGASLAVARRYISAVGAAGRDGPFGHGWSWRYGVRAVTHLDSSVTIHEANGRKAMFFKDGATWTPDAYVNATLVAAGEGDSTLTLCDQSVWSFNAAGQLTAIADRNGNSTTLGTTGGVLSSVTAPGGQAR